jgi:heme exporter protein D
MDFGAHTPYIFVAYAVSIIAISGLIALRIRRFRTSIRAEKDASEH